MLRDILDMIVALLIAAFGFGIQLFVFGGFIVLSLWLFLTVVGFCCSWQGG